MRRFLIALLAALLPIAANAAPAYVQALTVLNGTIPQGASLTPTGAGHVYFTLATDFSGTGKTITQTTTGTGALSVVSISGVSGGNDISDGSQTSSLWGTLALQNAAQTITVTAPSGDNLNYAFGFEFSGVNSVLNASYKVNTSPGTGAGAIVGTAVTVASGDILVAEAFDTSNVFGTQPTANLAGSTTIGTYGKAIVVYWTGTGASITPTFTVAANGTDTYTEIQYVMSASGGSSCTHSGITSAGAIAVPNGTTGSYRGKTGAFVTPDCSTVQYFQPTVGNFGAN